MAASARAVQRGRDSGGGGRIPSGRAGDDERGYTSWDGYQITPSRDVEVVVTDDEGNTRIVRCANLDGSLLADAARIGRKVK